MNPRVPRAEAKTLTIRRVVVPEDLLTFSQDIQRKQDREGEGLVSILTLTINFLMINYCDC